MKTSDIVSEVRFECLDLVEALADVITSTRESVRHHDDNQTRPADRFARCAAATLKIIAAKCNEEAKRLEEWAEFKG